MSQQGITEGSAAGEVDAEMEFWRRMAVFATAARMGVPPASRSDDLEELVAGLRAAARLAEPLAEPVPRRPGRGHLRAV